MGSLQCSTDPSLDLMTPASKRKGEEGRGEEPGRVWKVKWGKETPKCPYFGSVLLATLQDRRGAVFYVASQGRLHNNANAVYKINCTDNIHFGPQV